MRPDFFSEPHANLKHNYFFLVSLVSFMQLSSSFSSLWITSKTLIQAASTLATAKQMLTEWWDSSEKKGLESPRWSRCGRWARRRGRGNWRRCGHTDGKSNVGERWQGRLHHHLSSNRLTKKLGLTKKIKIFLIIKLWQTYNYLLFR